MALTQTTSLYSQRVYTEALCYNAAVGWRPKLVSPQFWGFSCFSYQLKDNMLLFRLENILFPLILCEDALPSGLTQGSSWKVGDVIWKLQMRKKEKENSAKKVVDVEEAYVSILWYNIWVVLRLYFLCRICIFHTKSAVRNVCLTTVVLRSIGTVSQVLSSPWSEWFECCNWR